MIVRPRFLKILFNREMLRLRKNPSALLLLGLLTAISLLLSLSRPAPKPIMNCWVVYSQDSPWIERLRRTSQRNKQIRVVPISEMKSVSDWRVYPPTDCAIEILSEPPTNLSDNGVPPLPESVRQISTSETLSSTRQNPNAKFVVRFLYPGNDPNVLSPFLQWFWPTTVEHFGETPAFLQQTLPVTGSSRGAVMERLKQSSITDLMNEEFVATILLIIVLFVTCCHLQVSFTSQDRERGTLMALALSPATPTELLASRYAFHLTLALCASAAIIGILRPTALGHLSFWLTIVLASSGLIGVGTVIASLSRTQSAAGVLSLCYMLLGGVVFYLSTKFSAFALLKEASFESHSLPLLFLSLKQNLPLEKAPGLLKLAGIVGVWTVLAAWLFQQRGWRT